MDAKLIEKLVPEELRYGYEFNRHGIITSPGKFEGETIATLYYWNSYLDGGDTIFEITEEERKAFDIGEGYKAVYLYESEYGFVHLYVYASLAEAQDAEQGYTDESEEDF